MTTATLIPTVIKPEIETDIIVLESETILRVETLTATAAALIPKTADDLTAANSVFKDIDNLAKAISTRRLELTRPIDALIASIIAEERKATGPLAEAKKSLGQRMITCEQELKRLAALEAKRLREEAEERARVEQARVDAIAAEEKRVRDEARAKQEADAKAEAEMFGTVAAELPPEPEPERKVIVPVVERPADIVTVQIPKSAARVTTRYKLDIPAEALEKIIVKACAEGGCIAGVRVVKVDEDAIERLVKAGVPMFGAVMKPVESVGAAGGRG